MKNVLSALCVWALLSSQAFAYGGSVTQPHPWTDSGSDTSQTVTLGSSTTAYSVGNAIVPASGTQSFSIVNTAGGALLQRMRLISNDTAGAWAAVSVNIDLWTAAPTGLTDHTAYAPSGTSGWIGQFQCTFSNLTYGDGAVADCKPIGVQPIVVLASGTTIYWSAYAATATGAITASKTLTLVEEFAN